MGVIVSDLKKSFGDNVVLNGFSHNFTDKKVTAIMGQSGSGKTTLLAIMMGLLPPDSGTVQCPAPISAVFQENRLCENLTASANIRLVTGKKYNRHEITAELLRIGLNDCENKAVSQLSGGMKRRVALLRALLADSEVLFLDEPFKGLDLDTKNLVMEYCKEMTKGKTVIFVTHDQRECDFFSDEAVEMNMFGFSNMN
jgi:NitT/TauT family transport system ATP-binding protein